MDEVKLLDDMCAAVPPPAAERLSWVRARIVDDLGYAAAGRAVSGRSRRGRVRALVLRPRLAVVGGVAAAASIAVLVTVGVPLRGGTALVSSAAAAQVLQRAATAALAQPVPRDNQFVYTEITGHQLFSAGAHKTIMEQMWQSADGSRVGTIKVAPCDGLTPGTYSQTFPARRVGHRLVPVVPTGSCVLAIQAGRNPPAVASYAGLRTLPTSPNALLAYINAHVKAHEFAAPKGQLTWDALQDILRDDLTVPPKLAAAIFRAAASMPGTTVIRHVVDAAGQPGIAVAMQMNGLSSELIFNPSTYRFIGSADVVTGKGSFKRRIGTVFYAMAVVRTAFTETAPAGPGKPGQTYQPAVSTEFSP